MHIALALAALSLSAALAHADTLTLTLLNPSQATTTGSTLDYEATVAAPSSNTATVYLNADGFNVESPLALDDSGFLGFPLTLSPGQSYTGSLFEITAPMDAGAGSYQGSFAILGGATADAYDELSSATFTRQP